MKTLSAIIVDDELLGRTNLNSLLKSYCPEIEVTGMTGSALTAKKLVYELNPDVLFLDINMPKVNGFEFLESLCERNFLLVMVTAYSEYGIHAVKANAVDYLLKPVSIKELQQTVKKLVELKSSTAFGNGKPNKRHDKIVISQIQGHTILDVEEIIRLSADDNYTTIFLKDRNKITASKTLKYFEEILPKDYFVRIHRSEIINIHYLKEITYTDGGSVVLKDGTVITISKGKLPEIVEKIKEHSVSKT